VSRYGAHEQAEGGSQVPVIDLTHLTKGYGVQYTVTKKRNGSDQVVLLGERGHDGQEAPRKMLGDTSLTNGRRGR